MNNASARQLRVLVLATTFPAVPGDGTPEFVLTLSSALARAGTDVRAVVPRMPGAPSSETIDGVQVRRFAYFPRRWEGLATGAIMPTLRAQPRRWLEVPCLAGAFLAAAQREARRFRPDVVHAHWIVPGGVVALALATLGRASGRRIPYVVTVHGADAFTLRSGPATWVKAAVMRHAEATIPVSRTIGDELARIDAVTAPIPMGVDVDRIRDEVGERRPEPGRLLFVGRLVEKKGVDVLLRALPAVPSARLVVVGDGPCRSDLESLTAELGLHGRVTFHGQGTRSQVMSQMARAASICIPSRVGAAGDQDGTPVVLAEAMAAGLPAVVTDIGGLAEFVIDGDNGLVVPAGDAGALAGAIGQILADTSSAERLGANARVGIRGSLDVESVRDRYLAVLSAAASR